MTILILGFVFRKRRCRIGSIIAKIGLENIGGAIFGRSRIMHSSIAS